MTGLVLYPLLSAALYYLGSRATITSFVWCHYPPKFAKFMDCSACTGFWYGLGLSIALQLEVLSLDVTRWYAPIVIGLCSLVWTPIVAQIMDSALYRLGSIDTDPPSES